MVAFHKVVLRDGYLRGQDGDLLPVLPHRPSVSFRLASLFCCPVSCSLRVEFQMKLGWGSGERKRMVALAMILRVGRGSFVSRVVGEARQDGEGMSVRNTMCICKMQRIDAVAFTVPFLLR